MYSWYCYVMHPMVVHVSYENLFLYGNIKIKKWEYFSISKQIQNRKTQTNLYTIAIYVLS